MSVITTKSASVALGIALAALVGGPSGAVSDPAASSYAITVIVEGEGEPTAAWINSLGTRTPLKKDGAVYIPQQPVAIAAAVEGEVVIAYGQDQVFLPIRFTPSKPTMQLQIYRISPVPGCTRATRDRLQNPGSAYDSQLRAYFTARRLAMGDGGTCGALARPAVVEAWFNRSYHLSRTNAHISLDPDARAAMDALGGRYAIAAQHYGVQSDSRLFEFTYDYQRQLADEGDFAAALAVNAQLQDQLTDDAQIPVAAVQGLTVERLARDRDFLAARGD